MTTTGEAVRVHVRTLEGEHFHIHTTLHSTVAAIKEAIHKARGIDLIMQKLIWEGTIMHDEAIPEASLFTEGRFLVLVTVKPRPPGMMTTAVALPLSYTYSDSYFDRDGEGAESGYLEAEAEDEEEREDLQRGPTNAGMGLLRRLHAHMEDADENEEDDPVYYDQPHVDGAPFAPNEVGCSARAGRPPHQNNARLHSRISANDNEAQEMQDRLRALPAFRALQEIVRVDPQIMLVLNTDSMRFEDPRSGQAHPQTLEERDAAEQAFWDACAAEVTALEPTYERTMQLLHEVRDTACALFPSQWQGSEWGEQLLQAAQLHDDLLGVVADVAACKHDACQSQLALAPVVSYMRGVSEQIALLAAPSRANEAAGWRDTVEAAALYANCMTANEGIVEPLSTDPKCDEQDAGVDNCADAVKRGALSLAPSGSLDRIPTTHTFDNGPPGETPAMLLLRFFRSAFEQFQAIKLDLANAQLSRLLLEDVELVDLIAAKPGDFVQLLNASDGDIMNDGLDDASDGDVDEDCDACVRDRPRIDGSYELYDEYGEGEHVCMEQTFPALLVQQHGENETRPIEVHSTYDLPRRNDLPAGAALAAARDLNSPASPLPELRLDRIATADAGERILEQLNTEGHSELMQALMQQWLHTSAGRDAVQEAAYLRLNPNETGQLFHARMLQTLGRIRLEDAPVRAVTADRVEQAMQSLSPDAEDAVERLSALGFERRCVIEAYLACNGDEMLAANFLIDQ